MVRSQDPSLTIARLAAEGGVGVETVRFYQRRGLMPEPARPARAGARGGVRRYSSVDVRRLRFIRTAQTAGFTLQEIGELLALDATDDRARVQQMARARVAAINARIAELQGARDALSWLVLRCAKSEAGPCPILTAFEDEQTS